MGVKKKSVGLTYEGAAFVAGVAPFRVTSFTLGVRDYRDDMKARVRQDGANFGQAFTGEARHQIGFLVEGDGRGPSEREEAVRPLMAEFEAAWDAVSLRHTPGGLAELRVGDRACFGQPRILDVDVTGLWDGVVLYTVEFIAVSHDWVTAYDPVTGEGEPVIEFTIPFMQHSRQGLEFPAFAPFTFGEEAEKRSGWVNNTGDKPAWPRFDIRPTGHDGVTNPEIRIFGVGTLQLSVHVPWDKTLTVITSPERRGVYLDGQPVPGSVRAQGLRLSEMLLPVGSQEVAYSAVDATGLSELSVQVRPVVSF